MGGAPSARLTGRSMRAGPGGPVIVYRATRAITDGLCAGIRLAPPPRDLLARVDVPTMSFELHECDIHAFCPGTGGTRVTEGDASAVPGSSALPAPPAGPFKPDFRAVIETDDGAVIMAEWHGYGRACPPERR